MTIANRYTADPMPPRLRFNRAQYHWIADNSLFDKESYYELIEGDIFEKMGLKQPHIGIVVLWVAALGQIFGPTSVVSQAPIVVDDTSEPQPDIVVTVRPAEAYIASGEITPAADVRLAIEVSVSTLTYDLGIKALLYARAGIPDYWVSDVANRRLIVHRKPTPQGYASILTLAETERIAPLAAPNEIFLVSDYLP